MWFPCVMDYAALILAILFVDLLALVSPGPNFILVSSTAVSASRRAAIWTGTGIATGSLIWAGGAALGIVAIFEALPWLGYALKVAGVCYLLYLGVRLLLSKGFQPGQTDRQQAASAGRGFLRGLLINLTNPKSAAYYASVFAAFLTPAMPAWVLTVLVLAIWLMSLSWHWTLAVGFSMDRVRRPYIRASRLIDRLCGGFLILLGLRLAWENR